MSFKDKWRRHTVATSTTRTVDSYRRNATGEVARIQFQELVHAHDVYRQVLPKDKVGTTLWHRGAKVGTV